MSRNRKSNDIRTPRENIKIGEREMHGNEPMILVKGGDRKELLSIGTLVEAICGPGTTCIIQRPGK